jgi:hypothetical protein
MGGGRLGGCEIPSKLTLPNAILPEPNDVEAELSGINAAGMAQVPATQQPQPVLSQGAFFRGACFCAAVGLAGIGMSGIIMAQGTEPLAPGEANAGNAPLRNNPMATNKAMIWRPRKLSIGDMIDA